MTTTTALPLVIGRDLPPAEAARLCADGLLVSVVGDVLVSADTVLDAAGRAACADAQLRCDRAEPGAWVLAHGSALWVHCGPVFRLVLERVVVLGPRGRTTRYLGAVDYRQGRLEESEVEHIGGVPVTVPERTAADALRLLAPPAALIALAELDAARELDRAGIEAALGRLRGARGIARARRTLRTWSR